jgi:hypothetical protein
VNITVVSTRSVTGAGLGAGQELLHLVQQGVLVSGAGLYVNARQVDEPGAGNGLGHVAAVFWVRDAVVRAIQEQCGSLDHREHGPDVDVPLNLPNFTHSLEARSEAIEIDETTDEILIPPRRGHPEYLPDEPIPSPKVLHHLGEVVVPLLLGQAHG